MARRRDINDIDEDEESQIVDYSEGSDNGDKPTEGHLIHPNLLSFPS